MSIGLLKFETIDGMDFYVNPNHIAMFMESDPRLAATFGVAEERIADNASIVVVNSIPLQVKESPKQIIQALINLRDSQIKNILKAQKDALKEPWQDEYDNEEEE